jgi:poly(A) polymerase
MKLHRADCLASHGDVGNWEFLKKKVKEIPPKVRKPKPLINGHDLLALGYSQGPRIGEILKAVEDRQLEGELKTKEQALEWVKREFRMPSAE